MLVLRPRKQIFYFLFFAAKLRFTAFFDIPTPLMLENNMFHNLPFTPRSIEATEARLEKIYDAARLGLRGDALALAAGMLPIEYVRLKQLDPIAEMAELKGRADGEQEMSGILHSAARAGDAKAALEILKHQHGWVAKQQVQVDVEQRISITSALELAEMRVINADYSVLGGRGDGADGPSLGLEKRPVEVRDVRLPVGAERNAAGTLLRAAQVATRGVAGPDRAHSSE